MSQESESPKNVRNKDYNSKNDFGIPLLGEFQNERSVTIFTSFNPIKRGYRLFKRLKRLLTAKSDVVLHQEDAKTLNTIIFIIISLGLLAYITYLIFF